MWLITWLRMLWYEIPAHQLYSPYFAAPSAYVLANLVNADGHIKSNLPSIVSSLIAPDGNVSIFLYSREHHDLELEKFKKFDNFEEIKISGIEIKFNR